MGLLAQEPETTCLSGSPSERKRKRARWPLLWSISTLAGSSKNRKAGEIDKRPRQSQAGRQSRPGTGRGPRSGEGGTAFARPSRPAASPCQRTAARKGEPPLSKTSLLLPEREDNAIIAGHYSDSDSLKSHTEATPARPTSRERFDLLRRDPGTALLPGEREKGREQEWLVGKSKRGQKTAAERMAKIEIAILHLLRQQNKHPYPRLTASKPIGRRWLREERLRAWLYSPSRSQ